MVPTSDDYLVYLQGSTSLKGLDIQKHSFPEGALDPYNIIMVTGEPQGVFTQQFFDAENAVVHDLLDSCEQYMDEHSVSGLSFYLGIDVPWATAMSYLNPLNTDPVASSYRILVGSKLNDDQSATLLTIETIVSPNSQVAVGFIRKVRDKLLLFTEESLATYGLQVDMYLFGAYTTTLDVQDALYAMVPMMIGATVGLVMLILAVSFGSIGLVVRLAYTVFVSLCWTYGLMVLVYQPGPGQDAFSHITPSILFSSGIYWIIPVMSFSILIGLALDYVSPNPTNPHTTLIPNQPAKC